MQTAKPTILTLLFLFLSGPSFSTNAEWNQWYKKLENAISNDSGETSGLTSLTQGEITAGLKEALVVGVNRATTYLSREGGFMNDAEVKIPMPDTLLKVEKGLRAAGQDALADDFILTMNRAAEKAVPATTDIFTDTIKNISIEDARSILDGPDDAATQYFRSQSESKLNTAILPIVQDTTKDTGVTSAYKAMTGNLGFLSQFMESDQLDLDSYITRKTLDGLFLKLAQEEKLIRQDPVARSSELLKKVFSN